MTEKKQEPCNECLGTGGMGIDGNGMTVWCWDCEGTGLKKQQDKTNCNNGTMNRSHT